MKKKISIKNLYLLLVISIGLIGLGIGSTYAVFTAGAEINNPITLNSNLIYDSNIIETIEVSVPAGETVSRTLNISNSTNSTLNYIVWYLDEGDDIVVGVDSGTPTGTIANGENTSVDIYIENNGTSDVNVIVGVSSSVDAIVLGSGMKSVSDSLNREAYAIYSTDDNSLMFYKNTDIVTVGSQYNGKTVTAVYTGIENTNYTTENPAPWYTDHGEDITSVSVADRGITPVNTAYWFSRLHNCSTMDLANLDTSNVESMFNMFWATGYNATELVINGLNNWDTSNVKDMRGLFNDAGRNNATTFNVDVSNFDTSQVDDMHAMFYYAGSNATTWSIGDLSSWNTQNVYNMSRMFEGAGYSATTFSLNLSNWNTAKVTNMESMFNNAGYSATTFSLDLSSWDTSNVSNMSYMFYGCQKLRTIYVSNNWKTDSVTNSTSMFSNCTSLVGENGTEYNLYRGDGIAYAHIDGGTSNRGYLTYKEPGDNLISFTVDGTTYQAFMNMTWRQWIDSQYNTEGWYAGTYNVFKSGGSYLCRPGGYHIKPDDFILPVNSNYYYFAFAGND